MSTTATTTRRTLYVGNLALDDTTPCLMPGDVIHIEATLTVRSVENGLDHFDRPAETITTRSDVKDGPQVAVRTSTLKAAGGNPLTTPPAEQGNPTIRERINRWRAKHRTTLGAAAVTGWAFVWVASIALLMISLTGCGTSTNSTPTPSPAPAPAASPSPSLNPKHVAICHTFKAKADDPTRSPAIRATNLAEYNARCQDVKAAEAKG